MGFKRKLLFSLFLLFGGLSYSQNQNILNLGNLIPPSPEVAAFGKYFDFPVGHNSGTPSVNIPFHTLQDGALTVPVGLTYHGSAFRVEEAATATGLGWTLNTGGNLSRIVRGLPDDISSIGYMYTSTTVQHYLNLDTEGSEYYNITVNLIPNGDLDIEPDIFAFSVLGYSGKFYYDQDSASFVLAPYQNIKIDYETSGYTIVKFILTLPNGISCYFGQSQNGSRSSYEYLNDQNVSYLTNFESSLSPNFNTTAHYSSWSLMELRSPTFDSITYYYSWIYAKSFGRGGEVTDYSGVNACPAASEGLKASFYIQDYIKPVLDSIKTNNATVWLVYDSLVREDVAMNEKSLDSVVIKNTHGKRMKSFGLSYDYTLSPDSTEISALIAFVNIARKRLILKSVTEVGTDGSTMPPFQFTYNNTALPNRLSANQDYWGYFNGKDNGDFLTPLVRTKFIMGLGEPFYNSAHGADRRVDTNFTQAGMLTKVEYPTGGYTEYIYEPNRTSQMFYQPTSGIERSDLKEKQFFYPLLFEYAPDTLYYYQEFSIGDIFGKVRVNAQMSGCPYGYVNDSCRFLVKIRGITDTTFEETINMSIEYYLTLPEGTYSMETFIDPGDPVPPFFIALYWSEKTDNVNMLVGGVRIKKIISSDNLSGIVSRSYSYNHFSLPTTSSGMMWGIPVHIYEMICGQCTDQGEILQYMTRVSSQSAVPLSQSGRIVHYLNVTEYADSSLTSQKTEFEFSFDLDGYSDGWTEPGPQHAKQDWQDGVLLGKKVYEKLSTGDYRPVFEERHAYIEFQDTSYYHGIRFEPVAMVNCSSIYGTLEEYLIRLNGFCLTQP